MFRHSSDQYPRVFFALELEFSIGNIAPSKHIAGLEFRHSQHLADLIGRERVLRVLPVVELDSMFLE
jgi:hypothetical protein